MTPDERLSSPTWKVKRAKHHIDEFERDVRDFGAANPYEVSCKTDPETRRLIYYASKVEEFPVLLSASVGDALFNMRAALDHLAQQFWLFATKSNNTARHVAYPIFDSKADFARGYPRMVDGMRQDAIDFIAATAPYKGGNDPLWELHRLNNIDKHRMLVTCGSAYHSLDIGPVLTRAFKALGEEGLKIDFPVRTVDSKCPLKAGDELFRDLADTEPAHIRFRFEIALHEPQILPSQPVVRLLRKLLTTVEDILGHARPLFT